jgi:hypothetical protein
MASKAVAKVRDKSTQKVMMNLAKDGIEAKAEDVGDKLIQAFGDAIPACESPSDLKDLATGFKAVYEPMFKTNPDTAIQFNQTTEQQPKTLKLEVVRVEN